MIFEFSIIPIGKGESVADLVAKALEVVDSSGLPYQLTAMGTIIEGEWDEVFELIKECHTRVRKKASRVMTFISVDDREKAKGRIEGKVKEVEEILNRRLKR